MSCTIVISFGKHRTTSRNLLTMLCLSMEVSDKDLPATVAAPAAVIVNGNEEEDVKNDEDVHADVDGDGDNVAPLVKH